MPENLNDKSSNNKSFEFKISQEEADTRLDKFLSECEEVDLSRQYIQELIKEKMVLVNSKPSKASYKLKSNDHLNITIPEAQEMSIDPENIPLDIVYEDEDLLVVNKPINMVTHPATGLSSGTLVNALLHHCKGQLSGINGVMRPGIVHRLDKDTSGLIIVAKNDKAHNSLAQQIQERSLERRYLAIVHNNFKKNMGMVDENIARHPKLRHKMAVMENRSSGRSALTKWYVKDRYDLGQNKQYCLIECKLETGRTHQIRVHMSWLRHPIIGDKTYGPEKTKHPFKVTRPMLHSYKMSFTHPTSGETKSFEISMPEDFKYVLDSLSDKTIQ